VWARWPRCRRTLGADWKTSGSSCPPTSGEQTPAHLQPAIPRIRSHSALHRLAFFDFTMFSRDFIAIGARFKSGCISFIGSIEISCRAKHETSRIFSALPNAKDFLYYAFLAISGNSTTAACSENTLLPFIVFP
jgi:hypothetical protein